MKSLGQTADNGGQAVQTRAQEVGYGTSQGQGGTWEAPCVRSADGVHHGRVVGYARGHRDDGLACWGPLSVVCRLGCGTTTVWRCKSHRASRCGPCSARYRLRVHRVASEGMLSRSRAGYQGMLTITAPGAGEHLGWIVGWDGKRPREQCSCADGMVGGLGSWNASAGKRWNVLRGALGRLYPGAEFFRAVEPQERGALHLHVIVWSPIPLVLKDVQACALSAGFGCVIDYEPAAVGDTRQAAYVSKYCTKATDQRGDVPWDVVDVETGEVLAVKDARYRTWSSSRGWGMTMKVVEQGIRDKACKRAVAVRESATAATVFAGQRVSPNGGDEPGGRVVLRGPPSVVQAL